MKSISLINISFAYDGADTLLHDLSATFRTDQTIAIVGDNGCGKSTLLKLICGALQPDAGTIQVRGRISYLNQDLSLLNPAKTVVENIMDIAGILQHDAHAIAANFGFRGGMGRRRVGTLSGGELLKATLAAILGSKNQPDLLMLDEPTNNLDIKSTTILEHALRQYRGAILLVSHDDEFVRNVASDWETVAL